MVKKRLKTPEQRKPKRTSPRKGKGGVKIELQEGADTAVRLLKEIQEHRLDPRDLTIDQRRACLMVIADGTRTTSQLARIFRCTPYKIQSDIAAIRKEVGRSKLKWGAEEVIGQAVMAAEIASARALKEGDVGLFWTINRDLARLMKELGVVEPKKAHDGMRITVEAMGESYERVTRRLAETLDPALTGEVIDQGPRHETQLNPPPLPLSKRFPREPQQAPPPVEIVLPAKPSTPPEGNFAVPQNPETPEEEDPQEAL